MEIRTLRYFLAVAREESFCKAGENVLFVTQPTLSRQMQELEEELGVKLFSRSNKRTSLTEEGVRFKKRAEEIVLLADRTILDFKQKNSEIAGKIYVGCAETDAMKSVANVFKELHDKFSNVTLDLFSGNAEEVSEMLDKGLLDMGIFIEPVNKRKYDYFYLQEKNIWGILSPRNSEIAKKDFVTAADLSKLPLIMSRQALLSNEFKSWFKSPLTTLNVVSTYNLIYNASKLVEAFVGYALCLDNLVDVSKKSPLKFIPLNPVKKAGVVVVSKKGAALSSQAALFMDMLKQSVS